MGKETELKLSLPTACIDALREHPVFASAESLGEPKTLDNTYFDTADLQLQAQHIAVRTRQQGDSWLQTVKCASESVAGLSQRPEWEQPYTGEFDFSGIDLKPLRKKLQSLQSELNPVFSTIFTRESYFYKTESGAEILLMMDQGEVLAKGQQLPLCELELELVSGSPQDLLEVAVQLAETIPVQPSDISKAERGYRLFLAKQQKPMSMPNVVLTKKHTSLDAFKTLAFACLAQWQGNISGVAVSNDPEFIHQLRISQRRLRALLRIFSPILSPSWVAHWSDVLAENARVFAEIRDLDVMCDEILPSVLLQPGAEEWSLSSLQQLVAMQRDQSRVVLTEHPELQKQGLLILTLAFELHALETTRSVDQPLSIFAQLRIEKLLKRAKKSYRKALKLQHEGALHELRKTLKPLRYALEFFMAVLPEKKTMKTYQSVVVAVRALGHVNDHHVTRRVLTGLTANDPHYQVALAYLSGLQSATLIDHQKTALRSLSRLF